MKEQACPTEEPSIQGNETKKETSLFSIVRKLTEELFPHSLEVGKITTHPGTGKKVIIVSGCFLDPVYGRVSNWWTWREVLEDGSYGKEESGYGW